MIKIDIPGAKELNLTKLVLDFNGTLALDGNILSGVKEIIALLSNNLEIHVLTSDTFGTVQRQCTTLPVHVKILETNKHVTEKADYIYQLGKEQVVAIGNGANDLLMLQEAALSILVIGSEGSSVKSLQAADIVVNNISDAFALLINPQRVIATLRA